MFNYYNPCSMCIPVPVYLKGTYPMMPMGYGYKNKTNENDDDFKNLYPKIYFKIYPLVKEHCDIMEKEKGTDYCPCDKEVNIACKKIYKRIKPELDDDEDDYTRQRGYRRRHAIRDLTGIILINELLGRRRRRRRYYDYNYDNDYDNYNDYDDYDDYNDYDNFYD